MDKDTLEKNQRQATLKRWPNLVSLLSIDIVQNLEESLSKSGIDSLDETERKLLNTDVSTQGNLRQVVQDLREHFLREHLTNSLKIKTTPLVEIIEIN